MGSVQAADEARSGGTSSGGEGLGRRSSFLYASYTAAWTLGTSSSPSWRDPAAACETMGGDDPTDKLESGVKGESSPTVALGRDSLGDSGEREDIGDTPNDVMVVVVAAVATPMAEAAWFKLASIASMALLASLSSEARLPPLTMISDRPKLRMF